jgi:hypothetical protein
VKKHKFITELNSSQASGFWVRIDFSQKSHGTPYRHQKFFSNKKHGGKRKALTAAIEHRNIFLKKNYGGRIDKLYNGRRAPVKPRTKTGLVGITEQRYFRTIKGGLREHHCYSVNIARLINDKMVYRNTAVSIPFHGYRNALAIAKEKLKHYKKELAMLEKKEWIKVFVN